MNEKKSGIVTNDLTVTYNNGTKALRNVSFEIPRSTITALVGVNGAGTVSYTHLTLPTKA